MLTANAIVVFVYLLSMVALGVYLSRYVKSEDDFFLAGRSLNKWVIAGSIMSTNVAAIYLVGPAGAAYGGGGVSALLIAWTGNMIAAISALFFVPHLRRMRITTISEYLEERYGVAMRLLPAGLWILYYACFAGVGMCTLSTVLAPVLGVRVESLILFVGGGVLIYCFFSGLIGAAYSSVIQAFIMILGGLILAPIALRQVGGLGGLYSKLPETYFVFWKAGTAGVWPTWKDVIMFVMLGLPYWCTSQYMVQRSFAGRSVRAASRGVILAALMTGPLTLSFIIPGICGKVLYGGVVVGDDVLPLLLRDFLPVGLAGLILASLIAASNSTASALLSSLSTLAQHDFYRRFIPGKGTKHYMWVARVATLVGGVVGIAFAFVARKHGIIQAAYGLMGFFEPPIFIIVAGALFWKRANSTGAICAAVVGITMNFVMIRVLGMQPASQAILSFPISAAALVGGTYLGDALSGSATSRGKTMFDVEGETKAPFSVSGWFGVVWAVGSLWAFIICSFCESALPKPANMFIFLFLMMSFVLGCYFAVPALVPGDDEENAPATGVGASLTQKIVGSGWTWLGVYVVAIGLMFAVYRIATPDPGRAQLTSARIEVRDIAAALAAYKEQHGAYPATDALIPSLQEKRLDENMKGKPYLRGGLDQTDAWGNPIVYEAQNGGSYVLYSPGPDGKPGTEDDIHPPTAGE
jgi:SSS family solute:Na+ symporter